MEKEDPNLITVFICFLRSGLRFTRYDTNNVGLAFIEEIKKHNPDFKPVKVQQKERDQIYTVNAYPKEFEQLILSLIEEYRKKNKLEYRLKKPRSGGNRGGFNRDSRSGGNRPQRSFGDQSSRQEGYSRPRDNSNENRGNRDGTHRPRREQGFGDNRNTEQNRDFTNSRNKPNENLGPRRPRRENND